MPSAEPATPSVFERHPRKTLVAVFLAFLGVAEAGLRLFDPGILGFLHAARQVHVYSERWRVDLAPGRTAHLRLAGDDGRFLYNFLLTTDADGLRGPDRDVDEAPPRVAARQVHCIGDSFTMGWGVSWAESYPTLLGDLLSGDVAVSNLGVDGFGTIAACEKSAALSPADHVVYLFHPGDVDDDVRLLEFRRRSRLRHALGRLGDALRRRSYLANLPYAAVWLGRFRDVRASTDLADAKLVRPGPAEAAGLEVEVPPAAPRDGTSSPSLDHLVGFAGRLAARGAGLTVLVLEPDDPRSATFLAGCRRAGLDVRALRVPPAWILRREGHLNRAGAEALALYVRDAVLAPVGLAESASP